MSRERSSGPTIACNAARLVRPLGRGRVGVSALSLRLSYFARPDPIGYLLVMTDVTATDAARKFADLLDAVERGEEAPSSAAAGR